MKSGRYLNIEERPIAELVEPIAVTTTLFLEGQIPKRPIARMADLTNQVDISNATKALSFVRLITSPRTNFALKERPQLGSKYTISNQLELFPLSQLSPEFVYGDIKMLDRLRKSLKRERGYKAIVNDEALIPELKSPLINTTANGFRILRVLVLDLWNSVSRRNSVQIVKVYESVDRNGFYKMDRIIMIDNALNDKAVKSMNLRFSGVM